MIVQDLDIFITSESYTHANWDHRNISAPHSRLYYIIDGEAYYEENGKKVRLKKNHLYLTPVKKSISLYDNPKDKLLHTYTHIITIPPIQSFTEVEVVPGTPLADAVAIWRKYIHSNDKKLMMRIVRFVISCVEDEIRHEFTISDQIRNYIEHIEGYTLNMEHLSREMGYCREYIARQFKMQYHITPMQYFNQLKMNAAMEMLSNGVLIQSVAEKLNYSSPYAFSKAFKNHFGYSPKRYTNSHTKRNM